jgi:hypothetical protein
MGEIEQTPVEWFAERLTLNGLADYLTVEEESLYNKLKEQAKEMEKQQREKLAFEYFKAGQDSMEEGGKSFEQYYT